jgi:ribonuclease-3
MLEDRVKLVELEKKIGYRFKNNTLLINALTHASLANQENITSYENLEFLGDSVLNLLVSSKLYSLLEKSTPGELTKYKSFLVSCSFFAFIAKSIDLPQVIRVSGTSPKEKLNLNESIMEDVVEAIFGAAFIDGGLRASEIIFKKIFLEKLLKAVNDEKIKKNYKAIIQDYSLKTYGKTPEYIVESVTGPPHMQNFEISVKINCEVVGLGSGKNKKSGEQAAAEFASSYLEIKS